MSDQIFDSVLEKAFNDYADRLFESYPSDEEMKKAYPVSEKRKKLYERIARAYKNGHGKRNKLSDYVACSFAGSDMEDKSKARKGVKLLKRVAIACIIIILLTATVIAVAPPVRDYIISWYKEYVQFEGVVSEGDSIKDVFSYNIGYIPGGYELIFEVENESTLVRSYYYQCGEEYFYIEICDSVSSSLGVSSDYPIHNIEIINDRETHIFYNGAEKTGLVLFIKDEIMVYVIGTISQEELVKIIENIK